MAFDTGATLPQRTLVRRGAMTFLARLLKTNGGFLRSVIRWGGVIDGAHDHDAIDLLWDAFKAGAPSIAITCGDKTSEAAGMGGFTFKGELELIVYHYSAHAQSQTEGRVEKNAAAVANPLLDPGLDWIMEATEELLVGQRAGASPSVKQVQMFAEQHLRTAADHTLWRQRYKVTLSRLINKDRDITQVVEEYRAGLFTSDMDLDTATPVVALQSDT